MHLRSLALLTLLALLTGCSSRSLYAVRESGDTAYRGGQYDAALTEYTEYLERKPGEPRVRANYGRTLLKLGRADEAAEQLLLANAQLPADQQILDDLSEALVQAKRNDELYRVLRANASDLGKMTDHLRLGTYALRIGDTDTARLALLTAARIDKGQSVEPQIALSDLYTAIGDREAAMRRLRMAYFIDSQNTDVVNRVATLNAITGPTFGLPPDERDPNAVPR